MCSGNFHGPTCELEKVKAITKTTKKRRPKKRKRKRKKQRKKKPVKTKPSVAAGGVSLPAAAALPAHY